MTTPHLDTPTIYVWDLDDNSTRFDAVRAWPSPDVTHIKFSISAALNALIAIVCLSLIVAIMSSRKIRSSPFNWYLLFVAIPDYLAAFFCFLTCVLSASTWEYYSDWMCGFQASYLVWAFTANAWMNAVIVYQIHKLLRYSHYRRRYIPPTIKDVCRQGAIVYVYSLIWGLLAGLNIDGFPMSSHANAGFSCFPLDGEAPGQTWFFFFVFIPMFMGIPAAYSFCAVFHIYWNELMPPEGRRRKIAMFLLRVVLLYFIVWLPFMLIGAVNMFVPFNTWIFYITAMISHLQGLMTALLCYYTDDDIKSQMRKIMFCRCFMVQDGLKRFRSSLFGEIKNEVIDFSVLANDTEPRSSSISKLPSSKLMKTSSDHHESKMSEDKTDAPPSPQGKNKECTIDEGIEPSSPQDQIKNKECIQALTWIRNGMLEEDDPTGEFKIIDQILPRKLDQPAARRASDIEGVADWMRNTGLKTIDDGNEEQNDDGDEANEHYRHRRPGRRHTSLGLSSLIARSPIGRASQGRLSGVLFGGNVLDVLGIDLEDGEDAIKEEKNSKIEDEEAQDTTSVIYGSEPSIAKRAEHDDDNDSTTYTA